MPHKVDHALTVLKSLSRDAMTLNHTFGDGIQAKRVASLAYDPIIFSNPYHVRFGDFICLSLGGP